MTFVYKVPEALYKLPENDVSDWELIEIGHCP